MFNSFLRFVELRGIQAAGKTTLARTWLQNSSDLVRVNRDDLREMLFVDSYKPSHEPLVKACEAACAKVAVERGYSVIIDDTNLTGSSFWKDLAVELGIQHTSHHLPISVGEAIKRDAARDKSVGAVVIAATAKRSKI